MSAPDEKRKKDRKEKDKQNALRNAGIAGASAEVVQRYGSAVKEHVESYTGIDNETGQRLTRSLRSISNGKIHPDYERQNLKQQAGFAAEVKESARANADRIINGDASRKVRADDVGMVNHPQYDHVETDPSGNVIPNSGTQMKFVGDSPEAAFQKLTSKKMQQYKGVKIEVPSDQYDGILLEADKSISKLQEQLDHQTAAGNTETAAKLKQRIEYEKNLKQNLRKSSVSSKEAMFAREHPVLSTVQDTVKVSNRAGLEAAQSAAVIGGSVSIVRNTVALVKGDIEADEALKNIVKETGVSAAVGYATGFVGSTAKGLMQNSGSGVTRALAKTNLPGTIAVVAVGATKTMSRYFKGEITGTDCFVELGEQGTGMVSSTLFTAIGQMAIPIPVVGGLIGGMVGYALASASYGTLVNALKEAQHAQEERTRIEQECAEQIKLIREYRGEIESLINKYMAEHIAVFQDSFDRIKSSLAIGDVDGFIAGANSISAKLGREAQFNTMEEFDEIMAGDEALKL